MGIISTSMLEVGQVWRQPYTDKLFKIVRLNRSEAAVQPIIDGCVIPREKDEAQGYATRRSLVETWIYEGKMVRGKLVRP